MEQRRHPLQLAVQHDTDADIWGDDLQRPRHQLRRALLRQRSALGTRNIATEAVYSIDPATGVATQVYVYPTAFDFGGLEHDAATGMLYGLSDSNGTGLYEINIAAQSTTFRARIPRARPTSTASRCSTAWRTT